MKNDVKMNSKWEPKFIKNRKMSENGTKSKNYLKSESFILSDQNRIQIEVPPKHGNGHFVLSHYSIFHYMQTNYYDRKSQFTINWKDKRIYINWPKSCKKQINSERDS